MNPKMINTILLIVAIVILTVNIILTIKEAFLYYPFAAHPGRMCSGAGGKVYRMGRDRRDEV